MVITPEEAERAGLQDIHIVFPVELHLVDGAHILRVCDDETARGAVLQLLIAAGGNNIS